MLKSLLKACILNITVSKTKTDNHLKFTDYYFTFCFLCSPSYRGFNYPLSITEMS